MIVRSLDELNDGERDIRTQNWRSRRIVLAKDGVGFSVHETVLYAGTVNDFWYANHVESVMVIEGEGRLIDKDTGRSYELRPGTLYLLDGHEHHRLLPRTDMRTICVFNPPVTGREVHDKNGVYPLIREEEATT